jgi:omega-amidase
MSKMIISIAQMQITPGDVARNFEIFRTMTAEAARRGSALVVFPELWSTGYVLDRALEFASEQGSGMFAQIADLAAEHRIAITGSILEKRGEQVWNSAPYCNAEGDMLGIYSKLHLFRLFNEEKFLQAGSNLLTLDMPQQAKAGMAICYDLRFPELFRMYSTEHQTSMMIIPAEWPRTRVEHWRALLIARAIENQSFVIACNNAGESDGVVFGGHSMIVDPWGRIVVEAGDEPQLITAEIELDTIAEARARIPVFQDRRTDIY